MRRLYDLGISVEGLSKLQANDFVGVQLLYVGDKRIVVDVGSDFLYILLYIS